MKRENKQYRKLLKELRASPKKVIWMEKWQSAIYGKA